MLAFGGRLGSPWRSQRLIGSQQGTTVFDHLREGTARLNPELKDTKYDTQRRYHLTRTDNDAWRISNEVMAHLLEVAPKDLYASHRRTLEPQEEEQYYHLLRRVKEGEPVEYALGVGYFYKGAFTVTPDTLIPRPDSETLVEAAVDLLKRSQSRPSLHASSDGPLSIADLGTGSGCLILSILGEDESWEGVAIDKSPEALKVARQNAENMGLEKRCRFLLSDWTSALPHDSRFHMIISNPPYVPAPFHASSDLHDPPLALVGGEDGLDCYRALYASRLHEFLQPKGYVLLEIGIHQCNDVVRMFTEEGAFRLDNVKEDLNGIERVVILQAEE